MKKIIALLLALSVIFAFAACGSDKNNEGGKTDSNVINENKNDVSVKVSRGTIADDVYTNEYAGFTFTKAADWTYLTDAEIAETINAGQAQIDLNFLEEALAESATVYDMAVKGPTGESVMVLYENTMLTALRKITADEYIDVLKDQLATISEITYTIGDVKDATLGTTDYRALTVNAESNGVEFTQVYYCRAVGSYIVGVIVTSFSEAGVANIEAMFN